MILAGCSHTVDGSAVLGSVQRPPDGYAYADNRCGLLEDATVQDVLGAQRVMRAYSGAVCQYILARDSSMLDVTFSWFETGTLERERALAEERGAQVTVTVVDRRDAFLARRDTTGAGCAATAAANPGVLSWWVQVRDEQGADPCRDAETLLARSLSSDM
ncbi:MAG: DUF3558 domain-containing protein [Mycobacterium sp.]